MSLRPSETLKSGAVCDGKAQVDTSLLFRAAANKIANKLVTNIYPIKIAAFQPDGTIILNYGMGIVEPDDVLSVFEKGSRITDPNTGEVLGDDEIRLGFIRVTDVTARFSKAVPLSSFAGSPHIGAIVRSVTPGDLRAAKIREVKAKR